MTFTDLARKGLCARCRWARSIKNRRGSDFLLCRKAAEVPELPKYPRLPVLECEGFEGPAQGEVSPPGHS